MDVAYCFWRSVPFGFFLPSIRSTRPPSNRFLVEPLQVQRSQIIQRDAADLRLDVVFEEALARS